MYNSHCVGRIKNAHDRFERRHCFRRRKSSTPLQFDIESSALDVFHDEVDRAVARSAQIVNSDGVGMTKATRSLAFALKTPQPFSVAAHFGRQKFDGNAIAQQNVTCAID